MKYVELILICISCIYAVNYALYNLHKNIKAAVGTLIVIAASISLSVFVLFFRY